MHEFIIYPKCLPSTENKPFRFFDTFFFSASIEHFRSCFYPDTQDPTSIIYQFPVEVDYDKEQYTLEYEVEIVEEENGFPIKEWREKIYTFEKYLNERFDFELQTSYDFIESNIENKSNKYKKVEFLNRLIDNSTNCLLTVRDFTYFEKYRSLFEFVLAKFIRHIYREYRSSAPKANDIVRDIIQSHQLSELVFDQKTIGIGIVNEILNLNYQSEPLFDFSDKGLAKKFLLDFITCPISEISGSIQFQNNTEAAYYFIHRLSKSHDIKPRKIEEADIIHFKKSNYTKKASYSNVNRFITKESDKKRLIDEAIAKHEKS
jgi:hypothetical protein